MYIEPKIFQNWSEVYELLKQEPAATSKGQEQNIDHNLKAKQRRDAKAIDNLLGDPKPTNRL